VTEKLGWKIFGTVQEMNHAVSKRQANDLQHHQRKCTIMFELSVNLERILEFLTLHLWHVFLDADAEMNLTRLCESLVRDPSTQHPPSLPSRSEPHPGHETRFTLVHVHVRHQPPQLYLWFPPEIDRRTSPNQP